MDGMLCFSGKGGADGKDLEEQMVRKCVHVCVAPPLIVGVWSMAVEYYGSFLGSSSIITSVHMTSSKFVHFSMHF